MICRIHGKNCPGDDGGFLIDGNHPDDMYSLHEIQEKAMNGTVVRLLGAKGFGFIRGEDGIEHFFHREEFNGFFEDLVKDYDAGRVIQVKFTPVQSNKGPRASEVTRLDGGNVL